MVKRQKSQQKRTLQFQFPDELTIYSCPSGEETQIITDAGFESIDYGIALKYFTLSEIIAYWESIIDFSDIESEAEIEQFEALISMDCSCFSEIKSQEFIEDLITQFSWLPDLVDVALAKAVCGIKYKWIKVLNLLPKIDGQYYIDSFETEAIWLGLALKKEINESNLSVINDNQNAVSDINHILSQNHTSILEKNQNPEVFWSPRNFVFQADRLKIQEATKIFAPNVDFEE